MKLASREVVRDPFTGIYFFKITKLVNVLQNDIEQISYTWSTIMSWTPVRIILQLFYKMYLLFVAMPMFYIYINGPAIGNFGFWRGKSLPDICSTITKVDSHFWTSSNEKMYECELIVFREYHSFMVGILSIVYLLVLGKMICWILGSIQRSTHQAYYGIIHSISQRSLNKNEFLEEKIIITERIPFKRRNSIRKSLPKDEE